eukprot:TRINITY_DN25186_c0_g1_i1.p1 TRINITY_DN25186_c0_g1~~TRINITY_DN25186_c0_g1_i1.p1  ORF type:complete len:250 (+),score=50.32 TRINITY_DN25186_c0_g1_i1:104-853(+)
MAFGGGTVYFDPEGHVVDMQTAMSTHGMTKQDDAAKRGLRASAPEFQAPPGAVVHVQQQPMQQIFVVRNTAAAPVTAAAPQGWAPPTIQTHVIQGSPQRSPGRGPGGNVVNMLIHANTQSGAGGEGAAQQGTPSPTRKRGEGQGRGPAGWPVAPAATRGGGAASGGGMPTWVKKGTAPPAHPVPVPVPQPRSPPRSAPVSAPPRPAPSAAPRQTQPATAQRPQGRGGSPRGAPARAQYRKPVMRLDDGR